MGWVDLGWVTALRQVACLKAVIRGFESRGSRRRVDVVVCDGDGDGGGGGGGGGEDRSMFIRCTVMY